MAQVWEGVDEVLSRPIAVKVLHPHLAARDDVVTRFRREAHAAARLNHRNVVSIFDTVSEGGLEAIVMELVRGPTLRQVLDAEGPMRAARVCELGAQVADALDAAHRAGVVHRDIKPANILLGEGDRVVVTDFGIAKARGDSDLTSDDLLVGTAKYLAPEQLQGGAIGPATDLYGLGVVLYEALAGQPPFQGGTEAATALARLREDPVPPRHLRPGLPRPLDDLIMKLLARRPSDRPATAGLVRDELRALAAHVDDDATLLGAPVDPTRAGVAVPTPAGPTPRFGSTERSWLAPAAVVVVVGVALAVAGALLGRTEAGRRLLESARDVVRSPSAPASSDASGTTVAATAAASAGPVAMAGLAELDPPPGDGREHPEQLPRAFDGDPATTWSTEGYNQRNFGTKPGAGLVIELTERAAVDELVVVSPTEGWGAQVFAADAPPADLDGWGDPVAAAAGVDGDHRFDLGGTQARYLLVWFRDLGEPDDDGRHRMVVGELSVRAGG